MVDDESEDDFDDWSDDEEFDSYEDGDYQDSPQQSSGGKKSFLIMAAALLGISVIGGYFAKDILFPQAPPPLTPNTITLSTANSGQDPLTQQAMAPAGMPQQPAPSATESMPPDLAAYDAQNTAQIINDSDFSDNATDSGTNDNPFADFADMSGTPPPAADDNMPVAIPFDTPNTGNPDEGTVIRVETLNLDDLTAPETNSIETPGPDVQAQPVVPVETTEILQVQTTDNIDATGVPDNTALSVVSGADDNLRAENIRLQDEKATLLRQLGDLSARMRSLESELEQARNEMQSNTQPSNNEPTPPATQTVKKSSPKTVTAPPKPTLPPAKVEAKNWVLRAATTTQAVISEPGSSNLITVGPGDVIPGYGRVQSIFWSGQDGWQVMAEGGIIRQ